MTVVKDEYSDCDGVSLETQRNKNSAAECECTVPDCVAFAYDQWSKTCFPFASCTMKMGSKTLYRLCGDALISPTTTTKTTTKTTGPEGVTTMTDNMATTD